MRNITEEVEIEKLLDLLNGSGVMNTASVLEAGIPSLLLSDGPLGLRYQKEDPDSMGINPSEPATVLLSGPAMAASWNPEIGERMGRIIGEEAAYYGVDLILAPAVNLVRSPLCGRNAEYISEDPLLAGKLGGAYIKGVQSTGVGACVKHFAANNQETEREYLDVKCDENVLRELYLKAFEIAIKEGRPDAVMTSLSKINGTYCAENPWLLDILRKEWGFDGIVMTDWFGLDDRAAAFNAGLNLEMPSTGGESVRILKQALKDGKISEETIRERAENMAKMALKLTKEKTVSYIEPEKMFASHKEEVWKAATESVVLLKNAQEILPLKAGQKIAVVGAYAEEPLFQTEGSGKVNATESISAVKEIARWNGCENTFFAKGYEKNDALDSPADREKMIQEAVETAKRADRIIVFLAVDSCLEGEGQDRKEYGLPEYQIDVLEQICAVNTEVIAVVMNGGAVPMPCEPKTKAILECFYGGQGIGKAITKILGGEVNPSGHMPVSVVKHVEQLTSYENFAMNSENVNYTEGLLMGYRGYITKEFNVQWPFGYGLSYSQFEITSAEVDKSAGTDQEKYTVQAIVKNNGKYAGAQVVQLYVDNAQGDNRRPVKELRAFTKIWLEPGEEKKISFVLGKEAFACYDKRVESWQVPEGKYGIELGFSSDSCLQKVMVEIKPVHPVPKAMTGWSKFGRFLETETGEKIFEELYKLIHERAGGLASPQNARKMTREEWAGESLRRVHLALWTEISSKEILEKVDLFNKSLYEKYRRENSNEY